MPLLHQLCGYDPALFKNVSNRLNGDFGLSKDKSFRVADLFLKKESRIEARTCSLQRMDRYPFSNENASGIFIFYARPNGGHGRFE
jgi:hypothetical protein